MDIQEKILEGTLELFLKYGVRSVSMDDIARSLSMSKKTLYQHFKDKDELVLLATKAYLTIEIKKYNDVEKNSKDPIEQLVEVNKCMRKDFKNMNPSLLFDLQKYHPDSWNEFLKFKNIDIKNYIAKTLHKGIAAGYFRQGIDPDIMAILRVEQVQIAFDTQLFPAEKYSLSNIQVMFLDHFVQGILTPKGKELYDVYMRHIDFSEKINQ